ncbi:MAG: chitobiase/beta-hexosaminidase C-terminal domain-containing protein [Armatimonadota bacterium]
MSPVRLLHPIARPVLLLLLLLGSLLAATAVTNVTVNFTTPNDEEFVGPFASWRNVQTYYGAVGDGVTDDTAAIQTALNDLKLSHNNGWSVLYFPAGTYRITSTLVMDRANDAEYKGRQVIGEDPATTTLLWGSSNAGSMLVTDAWYFKLARFTFDGNNVANIGVERKGNFDTSSVLADLWFHNLPNGIYFDGTVAGQAEQLVLRCRFIGCSGTGVAVLGFNSLDIWVWYSLFTDCGYGIKCVTGGFSAYNNVFLRSTVCDIGDGCGGFFPVIGNTSIDSYRFMAGSSGGFFVGAPYIQGNRIYDPILSAGVEPPLKLSSQPLTMMDNIIASREGTFDRVVSCGYYGALALNNTYTTAGWALQPKIDLGSTSLPVSNAFDNNLNTYTFAQTDPYPPTRPSAMFNYGFCYSYGPDALRKVVTSYAITSANDRTKDPMDWTLQATNDYITWTTLDARVGETFTSTGQQQVYSCTNATPYCMYRLNVTSNSVNNVPKGTKFAEMELRDSTGTDVTDGANGLASGDRPTEGSIPQWGQTYVLDDAYVAKSSLPTPTEVELPGVPPRTTRTVYEVTPTENATTNTTAIQTAINNAVSTGNRAVVHIPAYSYNNLPGWIDINSTLVIPANADIQLIGDGGKMNATSLLWTGASTGPILRIDGPSHVIVRDVLFNGHGGGRATAVQLTNADQENGEVYFEGGNLGGLSDNVPGEAGFYLTGNDDTKVTLMGTGTYGFLRYGVKSTGGPRLTAGVPTEGRFANISGAGGNSNSLLSFVDVQNGAKVAHQGVYLERGGTSVQQIKLQDTWGQVAFSSTRFSTDTSDTVPTFQLSGHNGELTLFGCHHVKLGTASGHWFQLDGDGSNTKALVMGSFGSLWNSPTAVWQDTTGPADDAGYFLNPVCNNYNKTLGAVPDEQFIRDRIAFPRSITMPLPQAGLGSDITAVRFYQCMIHPGEDRYGLQIDGATTPCATPAFTPPAGDYSSPQTVTISCATSGASIRYTTDGSTPSQTNGTLYTEPVVISDNCTLQAIAFRSGYLNSAVASGVYTITGALLHYPFSESSGTTTADATGNGHTGTLYANATFTTDGKIGNGIYLDGDGDYVRVPETAELNFNGQSFSVALWVKSQATNRFAFAKGRGAAKGWGVQNNAFSYGDTDTVVSINFSTLTLNTWTHCVVTVDVPNREMKSYKNGVYQRTVAIPVTVDVNDINAPGNPITIGARTGGYGPNVAAISPYFQGWLDEFYIYNRVLSADDVLNLYNLQ